MPEQVADPTAPEPTEPATGDAGADLAAEVEKWRTLARKHETRAKENATAAARLAEIEDAAKTEAQRLAERAEKAERALQDATLRSLRLEVAAEKGVPAGLLTGTTAEELAASADALLEFRGAAPKPPAAPPATGQGNVGQPIGDGLPDQLTRADLNGMSPDQIEAARAQGRLNALLGIK